LGFQEDSYRLNCGLPAAEADTNLSLTDAVSIFQDRITALLGNHPTAEP
jgi:hypothetical protein